MINKPHKDELSEYYQGYLKLVPEEDLLEALKNQNSSGTEFLSGVSESQSEIAYQPGKWKLKEVVGHLCDAERILVYRALRFARKDTTPLEGFEENDYAENANFSTRTWDSILEERLAVREASNCFFRSLDESMFDLEGTANGLKVSVRAILFFIIAHERHHLQVIKDRYLKI